MDVCPLVFSPIFKPKVWGGRRMASALAKSLPEGGPIGESWEIADLEDAASVVSRGPAAGRSLRELMAQWGADLTGRAALFEDRFPLLIKFLDARETLSVQVHPDERMAARLGGSVRVKHEAWYVIDAEPEGFIYRGLRPGVDRPSFESALRDGTVESLLERIPVKKGQCYYLPSGTVHALGAGVLVAEVQTPSDVTYRVFDFNRVDPTTGQPRDLHIDEALSCISFDPRDYPEERKQHVASVWTAVTRLVRCPYFQIERIRMADGVSQPIPHQELVVWVVLEGSGRVEYKGASEPLAFGVGDTVLLPAGLAEGRIETTSASMWLEVTVPIESALAGFAHPERPTPGAPRGDAAGFVDLQLPDPRPDARDR